MRGVKNPDPMNNPVWESLINSRLSAYEANETFQGPSSTQAGPCWCFNRYGQSETVLPDDRTVLIAGEHEDHYDPDFFIYNDVVLLSDDGVVDVYGYPTEDFPPTDFHSATLLDDHILLIGNLGYSDDRQASQTQILRLNIATWRVSAIEDAGVGPGWIHRHTATLTDNKIRITGGLIDRCDNTNLVENIDDWCLDLYNYKWERLTNRRWVRFEIFRTDRKTIHLWELRQVSFSRKMGWDDDESRAEKLEKALGGPIRLDVVAELFCPPLEHETLPKNQNEYGVTRISIGCVVVRYVEDSFSIQVTVEGALDSGSIATVQKDLVEKLEAIEMTSVSCHDIDPD